MEFLEISVHCIEIAEKVESVKMFDILSLFPFSKSNVPLFVLLYY